MPRDEWAFLVDPLMEAMRASISTAGGSTSARMSPSRARANRPASSTSVIRPRGAPSRSSSRSSSWTNGPEKTRPRGAARDAKIRIDLREPTVATGSAGAPVFPSSGGFDRLSVVIPQIHRKDESTFYPQLTRDLAVAVGDALLQACCEFMTDSGAGAPPHYRSLGRSAFLAASLDADTRLDTVARSFDFLLSISPINNREAMERFFADGEAHNPEFRYRPLTVDPDAAKRDLYSVDLSIIEDPLLERLLSEKRQELDHQLTMLATRNTGSFKGASMMHYGTVGSQLLADAGAILARPRARKLPGKKVNAAEVAQAARALVGKYQTVDKSFDPKIEIRDDVSSLLVSGRKLMIASSTSMLRSRVDALLAHEVSVHLLTHFNGAAQGLSVFRTGLAHYEGLQEGLGVFAEWAVGRTIARANAAPRRRVSSRSRRCSTEQSSSTSTGALSTTTVCRESRLSISRPGCSGRAGSPRI
jgi:uncharacterized protein (TIGR02421 family)